jgi:16S rRNA G1207 methylase RsmC
MELKYSALERLPKSQNSSLKSYNAADELLLNQITTIQGSYGIYNDQFGCLTVHLAEADVNIRCDLKSQADAIVQNFRQIHDYDLPKTPTFLLEQQDFLASTILLKIPKSIGLFEQFLQDIHAHLADGGVVYAGFMTKYFSKSLVETALKYFNSVEQTRAFKKARLLVLRDKKKNVQTPPKNELVFDQLHLEQFDGVFSAKKVDKATRHLLAHLPSLIPSKTHAVLDLACGNGIIGLYVNQLTQINELHFLDDSQLAIASAQLNGPDLAHYHHDFQLNSFEDHTFDWIITNPPFHFGHTVDTSIAQDLFKQAYRCLQPGGYLTIVSNANLGYEWLLKELFAQVDHSRSTSAFNIFHCLKV